MACSIAKNLGAGTTVARIDHYGYMAPENREPMRRMGVDRVIYPEYLAAQEIITALEHPWTRYWFEFHHGEIILAGIRLRAGAPIVGMQLKEFAKTNHKLSTWQQSSATTKASYREAATVWRKATYSMSRSPTSTSTP